MIKLKNIYKIIFVSVMCTMCVLILTACGDGEIKSATPKSYNISYETSPYFDISGTYRATAGSKAKINVDLDFEDASNIEAVYYNNIPCEYSVNDDAYIFTMPNEDVFITVDLIWNDLDRDSYLSWSTDNNYEIVSAFGDDNYYNDYAEIRAEYSNAWMIIANTTILSTNEAVIPISAITVVEQTSEDLHGNLGNSIVRFDLRIDRSQIKEGTTQIVLSIKNGNTSNHYTIVKTISVTNQ